MNSPKFSSMTPDEFRRHGHAVIDWIADYHSRIESFRGAIHENRLQ